MAVLGDTQLNQLTAALRAGSQAKSDLLGIDERYADTKAKGNRAYMADRSGNLMNWGDLLTDATGQYRSDRDLPAITQQRAAARGIVADNENAQGLYDAGLAQAKVKEARRISDQNQSNADRTYNRNVSEFGVTSALNKAKHAENVRKTGHTEGVNAEAVTAGELVGNLQTLYRTDTGQKIGDVKIDFNGNPVDIATGQPIDMKGKTITPPVTGQYAKSTKVGSSQHGRYLRTKTKDAYGNDVITVFDKQTSTEKTPSFGDGTPYSADEAKKRGGRRATQKGDEAYATAGSKYSVSRQGELMEANKDNNKTLNSIDQAINALKSGAGSGWLESKLPSLRASSIALDNARENLALTQIGQFTFGSLSEAEGNWLRGSVMPHLDEDELLPYMEHRKEATMRVMEASEYEREALAAGEKVDEALINQILRDGGFNLEEYGYKN